MYLVIVDAYSKFVEVVPMGQATTTNTIAALRRVFSYFGLPEHLVTDNGSHAVYKCRVSEIFKGE